MKALILASLLALSATCVCASEPQYVILPGGQELEIVDLPNRLVSTTSITEEPKLEHPGNVLGNRVEKLEAVQELQFQQLSGLGAGLTGAQKRANGIVAREESLRKRLEQLEISEVARTKADAVNLYKVNKLEADLKKTRDQVAHCLQMLKAKK